MGCLSSKEENSVEGTSDTNYINIDSILEPPPIPTTRNVLDPENRQSSDSSVSSNSSITSELFPGELVFFSPEPQKMSEEPPSTSGLTSESGVNDLLPEECDFSPLTGVRLFDSREDGISSNFFRARPGESSQ